MTHESINIDIVLDSFEELWDPRILAQVGDWDLRVVKVKGDFVWHVHPDNDELFIVLDGTFEIGIRESGAESRVRLGRHDVFVVPQGTEHRTQSPDGASVLLIEPTGMLNTGAYDGELPAHVRPTIGRPLSS